MSSVGWKSKEAQKKAPRDFQNHGVRSFRNCFFLQCPYIGCRRALLALLDVKAHALTLLQGLESLGLNRAVMNENVFAAIHLDEPKAFSVVKPFNGTFCHNVYPPFFNFSKSDYHYDSKKRPPKVSGTWRSIFALQNASFQLAGNITWFVTQCQGLK